MLVSCLFNSDAGAAGQPSDQSAVLKRICVESGMHHHQLARRAIENYLPRSAFEYWILEVRGGRDRHDRRTRTNSLFELPQLQRHYEDVKKHMSDSRVGHVYAKDAAMNEYDLQQAGGPAELSPFVRELIERAR